jgi:hypothetical protein
MAASFVRPFHDSRKAAGESGRSGLWPAGTQRQTNQVPTKPFL